MNKTIKIVLAVICIVGIIFLIDSTNPFNTEQAPKNLKQQDSVDKNKKLSEETSEVWFL